MDTKRGSMTREASAGAVITFGESSLRSYTAGKSVTKSLSALRVLLIVTTLSLIGCSRSAETMSEACFRVEFDKSLPEIEKIDPWRFGITISRIGYPDFI